MGVYKAYWMTDIPLLRFAEVANTSLRRFGWKDLFVNDEMGTLTANKEEHKDTMGTTWTYKYRAVMRWISLATGAGAVRQIP